jgi:hypothetical protein
MTERKPPKLAAWLLTNVGMEGNAPLTGDLFEEFENGRSAAWFWRQALGAIAVALGRALSVNRYFFLAYFLGFGAQASIAVVLWRHDWPHQAHGLARMALCTLYGAWILSPWRPWRLPSILQRWVPWLRDQARGHANLAALVAGISFSVFLAIYFLFALFGQHDPFAIWLLIAVQAVWFFKGTAIALGFGKGGTA